MAQPLISRSAAREIKVAINKLHASRPRKDFNPPPPSRAALSQQYSVASFATLQVLSCLHSPGLRCSCCNVVRFCCDLEACNLMTATVDQFGELCSREARIGTDLGVSLGACVVTGTEIGYGQLASKC
jgi:hypothetical protein